MPDNQNIDLLIDALKKNKENLSAGELYDKTGVINEAYDYDRLAVGEALRKEFAIEYIEGLMGQLESQGIASSTMEGGEKKYTYLGLSDDEVSDLEEKILEFLNEVEEPQTIGQINNSSKLKSASRRMISTTLMGMKRFGQVYMSYEDGKAYFSIDSSKGSSKNGWQSFVDDIQAASDSNQKQDDLGDALLKLSQSMAQLEQDLKGMGIDLNDAEGSDSTENSSFVLDTELDDERGLGSKAKTPKSSKDIKITFKNDVRLDFEKYSICIPDGFSYKVNYQDRDFWAWYPDEDDPDDMENAPIILMASMFLLDDNTSELNMSERGFQKYAEMKIATQKQAMPDFAEIKLLKCADVKGFYWMMEDMHYYPSVFFVDGQQQFRIQINDEKYKGRYGINLMNKWMNTVCVKDKIPGLSRPVNDVYFKEQSLTASLIEEIKANLIDRVDEELVAFNIDTGRLKLELSAQATVTKRKIINGITKCQEETVAMFDNIIMESADLMAHYSQKEPENPLLYKLYDVLMEGNSVDELSTDVEGEDSQVTTVVPLYKDKEKQFKTQAMIDMRNNPNVDLSPKVRLEILSDELDGIEKDWSKDKKLLEAELKRSDDPKDDIGFRVNRQMVQDILDTYASRYKEGIEHLDRLATDLSDKADEETLELVKDSLKKAKNGLSNIAFKINDDKVLDSRYGNLQPQRKDEIHSILVKWIGGGTKQSSTENKLATDYVSEKARGSETMNDSPKVDPVVETSVIKYLGGRKTPTTEAEIEKAFKGIDISKNEMEETLELLEDDDKIIKFYLGDIGYYAMPDFDYITIVDQYNENERKKQQEIMAKEEERQRKAKEKEDAKKAKAEQEENEKEYNQLVKMIKADNGVYGCFGYGSIMAISIAVICLLHDMTFWGSIALIAAVIGIYMIYVSIDEYKRRKSRLNELKSKLNKKR